MHNTMSRLKTRVTRVNTKFFAKLCKTVTKIHKILVTTPGKVIVIK